MTAVRSSDSSYDNKTMKRKKSKESDVTRAFIKTADDYILLADNIDEARNRAFMAVLAWNISLYPQEHWEMSSLTSTKILKQKLL